MEVEIYGTEQCLYCKLAVKFCVENGLLHTYKDVTTDEALIENLKERLGYVKTVPQIFVDGEHIGGYADLVNYSEVAA